MRGSFSERTPRDGLVLKITWRSQGQVRDSSATIALTQRAGQPVEPGHHQHVTGIELVKRLAELGTIGPSLALVHKSNDGRGSAAVAAFCSKPQTG